MSFFADAFIPFTPLMPAAQLLLLAVIILIEGSVLKNLFTKEELPGFFWSSVFAVNCATTILGLLFAWSFIALEFSLASSWSGDSSHRLVGVILFGFVDPWLLFLLCYHVSWRVEAFLLQKCRHGFEREASLKVGVRRAHRYNYSLMATIVVAANMWAARLFLFPRT